MWRKSSFPRPVLVGIRREDRTRIWERRAPLTPDDVHNLVSSAPFCNGGNGVAVEVVSCSKRVFTDSEYERAGARIVPQLSNPNFILGVKEPPIGELDQLHPPNYSAISRDYPNAQTHLMFSHTMKGQPYNMPLLSRFLNSSYAFPTNPYSSDLSSPNSPGHSSDRNRLYPTLIDYELLTNESGKRSVGFGWFAGAAGVPEAFSSMAQSHLEQGVASPFLYTARPYTHRTLADMQKNLQLVGSLVLSQGLPDELGPFVIGLTGSGNVSQGVMDTLKELPLTMVKAEELPGLMENQQYNKHTIYLVHVKPEDYLFRNDGQAFDKPRYYLNPEQYKSLFHERIAPYLTLFINGVGWGPKFPRLMTRNQLSAATYKASNYPGFRFANVADISCDINGGLEFLDKATTLSAPFYDIPLPSSVTPLRMMAVDILPTAIPIDASKQFSNALLPYLTTLIEQFSFGGNDVGRYSASPISAAPGNESGDGNEGESMSSTLRRATVARGGELLNGHKWLRGLVEPHVRRRLEYEAAKVEEGVGMTKNDKDNRKPFPAHPIGSISAQQSSLPSSPHPATHHSQDPGPAKTAGSQSLVETSNSAAYSLHLPRIVARVAERMNHRNGQSLIKKRVLLLGSGMVAQPVVDYLVCKAGVEVMIASNSPHELKRLEMPYTKDGSVETRFVDFDDPKKYQSLVFAADVVISLLPAQMHHKVAEVCISAGKPLVTASYMSHEMVKLDIQAKQRGVLILTEMGLDPGLDHLSAVNLIDKLKHSGRNPVSFTSMCGGLPAPEDALDVPLKYKFSWRPEGVLIAALQDARFCLLGDTYVVSGDNLLSSRWGNLPIVPGIELEGLPNRDSFDYLKLYRLPIMRTFVRGTLRYPGYSSLLDSFKKLGLLNTKKNILPQGWDSLVRESMLAEYDSTDGSIPSLLEVIKADNLRALHDALEWLGLATPTLVGQHHKAMPPLPLKPNTPISIFAYLLSHKLRYQPTDKDMVILSHEIISTGIDHWTTGQERAHTSTLVAYGTDQMHVGFHGERPASAMARTVGFPAAIAAMLVVHGKLDGLVGVRRPAEMEICRPILRELEEMGILFEEKMRHLGLRKEVEEDSMRGKEVRRVAAGTVEGALALAVPGVPEEKRKRLETGEGDRAWILDLDSDKGWEEEEVVGWPEKETKRGR